jgi:phenylalanyl-tRNA synthetase alpha chain
MSAEIIKIKEEILSANLESREEIENFRLEFLSKNGKIPALFSVLKEASPEEKRNIGQAINEVKHLAQERFEKGKAAVDSSLSQREEELYDYTLPAIPGKVGGRHPLSIVRDRMVKIFERIGFNVSHGPEIEDDWHNFSALNFPPDHPAREMQDTFFISKDPDIALRTHTSSVQVRVMEGEKPPIRTLSPGRVFRNEAISARAHCIFHQVEGLYINKEVSFVDLKETLFHFSKEFFGPETKIRLRPSYFPFTEPSAELDVSCPFCAGKGCKICKGTGWVEIGGAGMVDPRVLRNCKIDPDIYSGFAFGMGIERITMLKYQINDIRLFFENDLRFLKQFQKEI